MSKKKQGKEVVFKHPDYLGVSEISTAHLLYLEDVGEAPTSENDLYDYIFKKYFIPKLIDSKSDINLYFFTEMFQKGYSAYSEKVVVDLLAERGVPDLASYLPTITDFFVPNLKFKQLTNYQFANLKKLQAPFILRTMDAINTPSIFVLPSMNLEVKGKCYSHSVGYRAGAYENTLYKYKQHTVIFSNSQTTIKDGLKQVVGTWQDSPQLEVDFEYTASLIRNVLGFGELTLNNLTNKCFKGCKMVVVDNTADSINKAFDEISANKEEFFAIDTETNGLNPFLPKADLLTIQIAPDVFSGYLFNFSNVYGASNETRALIVERLNALYREKTAIYFNMAFEAKWLGKFGVCIGETFHDAQLLWKTCDLNVTPSLHLATKLHAPELAGYSDVFDTSVNKSVMSKLTIQELAPYAIGDAIATYRVMFNLLHGMENQGALYQTYRIKLQYAYYMSQFLEQVPHPINRKLGALNISRLKRLQLLLKKKRLELIPSRIKLQYLLKPTAGRAAMFLGKNNMGGHVLGIPAKGNKFEFDVLYSEHGLNLKSKLPANVEPSLSKAGALFYLKDEPYVKVNNALNVIDKLITTYLGEIDSKYGDKGLFGKSVGEDLYANFSITTTKTGRVSCNPSLQNIPNKTASAKCVNTVLQAPKLLVDGEYEDFTYLFLDYSQVELRVAAVLSGDENMMNVYRSGGDIHTNTAAILCGMTLDEFKEQEPSFQKMYRQRAKAVNFGLVYGMQAKTLVSYAEQSYGVKLSIEEAEQYRTNFFNAYPKLRDWHDRVRQQGTTYGFVMDVVGFPHQHNNATHHKNKTYHSYKEKAIRNLTNSPVQGLAAHLCLWAGAEVMRGFAKMGVTDVYYDNTIHDALYFRVPTKNKKEYASYIKWQMENLPISKYYGVSFDIPLVADVEFGTDYARHEEVDVESVMPPWAA